MKKILSLVLSMIMALSVSASVGITAYAAGAYDTVAKARDYTIGSTIGGTFAENSNGDFIKFTLFESGRLSITASGSKSYHYDIYSEKDLSYRFDYNNVNFNDNLGKSYDEYTIMLVAGTYYFKVDGSDNQNYSISTSFESANESFYESLSTDDDIIGNANDISLNTSYKGAIGRFDPQDFYRFTVSSGTYKINVKSDGYLGLGIYTMTGENITRSYFSVNDSTGYAQDSMSVSLSSGTYCLKIYDNNKYDGAFYRFSINSPKKAPAVSKPGKPSLKSVKATKKGHKISASWSKASKASGYQVCWYKDSKCKKYVAGKAVGNATSCAGKNFTKGKKYYVRVRAYKTANGSKIYGAWSNVKSVKAK